MDRNIQPSEISTRPTNYRRHSIEFKRAIVEQCLAPGASVARIARSNGINANQVFSWRKLYQEGKLGASADLKLLPVSVVEEAAASNSVSNQEHASEAATVVSGIIRIDLASATLTIEGQPDLATLSLVLKQALR